MTSFNPDVSKVISDHKIEETPKVKCSKCKRITDSTIHQMLTADMKAILCSKCAFQGYKERNPIRLKEKK